MNAIDSVVIVIVYASGFAALLALRQHEPDLSTPYRVWWYPWSTVCSLGFLTGAVIGDLKHSLFTVVLAVLSYLASRMIQRPNAEVPALIKRPASPGQSPFNP